jgi:hypothetical protein
MNAKNLKHGEVRVEEVQVSALGMTMIILEGQIAESDRYMLTLRRRKARLNAELRELESQMQDVSKGRQRLESQIDNAARAVTERHTYKF